MENFLKNYAERVEPLMNYTSKLTSLNEFEGMRNTVVMIGGALSFIIGLVGILNFTNAVLTSILTRRREPLLIVLPFLFILGIAIPLVSYAMTDRQSIVERLRAVEIGRW